MALGVTKQPYYPPSDIQTGKYTSGGEFVFYQNYAISYEGLYHILPNGQIWTHASPHRNSKRLQKKRFEASEDVKLYNKIRNESQSNYMSPTEVQVIPNTSDYDVGHFYRYFVQKVNSPISTLIEVDVDQINSMNSSNNEGINSNIWNSAEVKWYIKGKYAGELNQREVSRVSKNFTGIEKYLVNFFEYVK